MTIKIHPKNPNIFSHVSEHERKTFAEKNYRNFESKKDAVKI
jgi:hypothetical protein